LFWVLLGKTSSSNPESGRGVSKV